MRELVLDAWAIMAWLKDQQPAANRVRLLLDSADRGEQKLVMNIINLGEVFYLSAKAQNATFARAVLDTLRSRITIVSATDELVLRAAELKSQYAISYADAFAAATAISRQVPLVTGEPELRQVARFGKALRLEWIG